MGGIAFRGTAQFQTNKQTNMKKLLTTLSALAMASALSIAEDKPAGPPPDAPKGPGGPGGGRPNPEEIFKKLDANNDGSVSLEEFKAGPRAQKEPEKAEEAFKGTSGNCKSANKSLRKAEKS